MVLSSLRIDEVPSLPRAGVGALPETCSPRPAIVDAGSRALYLGPSFTLGPHRNTVAVLAFGLEREFTLSGPDGSGTRVSRSARIPPGAWQHLDAHGGAMAFLYLDADDRAWRSTAERPGGANRRRPFDEDAAISILRALRQGSTPRETAWPILQAALGLQAPTPLESGIAAAMDEVQRDPAATHPVASAATLSGCSISTFQRRFSAQAGLPWRRWRLWQRVRHAARAVCAGRDLTRAALDAGFASGAHFSDTFRAMFGLPPSRLVEWGVEWQVLDVATESADGRPR